MAYLAVVIHASLSVNGLSQIGLTELRFRHVPSFTISTNTIRHSRSH